MGWILRSLSRFLGESGWRDIISAPCDCAVQLAALSEATAALDFPCLRHGNAWYDARTMRPIAVSATHWRYWRPDIVSMSCC